LPVFIELGYVGGRTGCRDREQATALAARVSESPVLELRGVSGFEGLIQASSSEQVVQHVEAFLREFHDLVVDLERRAFSRGTETFLSPPGSAYFDIVVDTLGPHNFDFPVTTIPAADAISLMTPRCTSSHRPWHGVR
jgi:D-serine dehydratase